MPRHLGGIEHFDPRRDLLAVDYARVRTAVAWCSPERYNQIAVASRAFQVQIGATSVMRGTGIGFPA